MIEIATLEQVTRHPCATRGLHVGRTVADQEGARGVDVVFGDGLQDHARIGIPIRVVGVEPRGPVFDSSLALASAAAAGAGVALLPLRMFEQDLADGRLLQPFAQTLVLGRYWLTRLRSRAEREPLRRFRLWLQAQGQA